MRIIGHIEHPEMKITVFKMDNRVSVKFENALYEQTYKLGTEERLSTLEGVRQCADAGLLAEVAACFRNMHRARMEAYGRTFPIDDTVVFEEII